MSVDGYFREKLGNGVGCLVGVGDIRSRLQNAFFSMTTVSSGGFSNPDLGAAWDEIFATVTKQPALGDEGTIVATLRTMSEDELAQVARDLLYLYERLLREANDPYL
ncbi:hypothetical protein [Agrobacterium vitis]|uniref:hypothetical protein n=1 Tax=Agrobacterium vitis TaxID=373 RepID=UPI0015742940|nr:hypothetical protein [Agrobacterium vitis]NSZ19321.1 hypothetical protein [Agrobacterium vitis]QZO06189.1 hypothetical protein K4831_21310 [Agrobacterium vitis]UJL90512.1 hypothetical protein AVF2S5_21345 [Agrobacterium vitis]